MVLTKPITDFPTLTAFIDAHFNQLLSLDINETALDDDGSVEFALEARPSINRRELTTGVEQSCDDLPSTLSLERIVLAMQNMRTKNFSLVVHHDLELTASIKGMVFGNWEA